MTSAPAGGRALGSYALTLKVALGADVHGIDRTIQVPHSSQADRVW